MPRYGTWRPVDRYQSGSRKVPMTPRRLILHTAVSNATPSMHSYFQRDGVATSHFYVGRDGEVEQYIDTGFQSTANLEGNHDCITVETWDGYGTSYWRSDVPPWTDAQVEALARLAAWCYTTHGIPLERLPSSRPGTRGVGWHRLGIDGNFPSGLLGGRVEGGERWSSAAGKVCPGDDRIRQTVNDIIPRALALLNGDDEMQLSDQVNENHTVKQILNQLDRYMNNSERREQAVLRAFADLPEQVAAALPTGTAIISRADVRRATTEAIRKVLGGLDEGN